MPACSELLLSVVTTPSVKCRVLKCLILHLKVTFGKEHPVVGEPTQVGSVSVKLSGTAWILLCLSKLKSS